ncbi:uncharacterized protein [Epargyreus clarus]|uniref:uncharacterized protein n=1 Tax=Epargyreus clarus TaxID=520877 RepID=UPI003C2F7BA5
MALEKSKVWMRFASKRQDGSIVKLRIQDLPKHRMEDFMTFLTTYFIKDESFHKAAGVYKSEKATEEYKIILNGMYEANPPQIAICCLDTESEDFDEILAVSTVQLVSPEISLEDAIGEMGMKLENKETQALLNILVVLSPTFPKSVKEKYENYYEGRGIIVRPDYRGLRIASQIVIQRRLLCQEYKVPMTCAWMTSLGSQKAAKRDGWETIAEITLEELGNLTGLDFGKDVPTYKLMMATPNS